MLQNDETTLVQEAKSGSSYALARLLEQNYACVYKYILKLTLDSQLAADVTQDCMLKVIDRFVLFDPEKSRFSTWMIAIARNLCMEEYRKIRRRQKISCPVEEAAAADAIDGIIESDGLLSALRRLDAKMRIPLILRHEAGYSYKEIARLLKIPVGTVKSRISNGLKLLRKELEQDDA